MASLVTPNSEACRIFVDGEPYFWRDGEAVMFDETFIHWAENKTPTTRIILFCDIERPLTSRLMTRINRYVIENFVKVSATGTLVDWFAPLCAAWLLPLCAAWLLALCADGDVVRWAAVDVWLL